MKKYLVSVGDSDKYVVSFDGSKDEFKKSAEFKEIKNKVSDFLTTEFPTGGYADVVEISVEDDNEKGYPILDIAELLKSAKRQVEVLCRTNMQNLNAPFDKE